MKHRTHIARVIGGAARLLTAAAVLLTSVSVAGATQLSLGAAAGYNVFTLSNFSGITDSEGRVAVGGNFTSDGFSIASAHRSDGAGVYDLVVAGNFTMSGNSLGGGDVFIGGNMNWTNPTLPHNAYVNGDVNNPGGGSDGGTIFYHGSYSSRTDLSHKYVSAATASPIDFLSAKTNLETVSTALSTQKANGSVSLAYNTYTLTGSNSVNVFFLEDTSYSSSTINIKVPEGSTVIVNVAGTSDSFKNGSINLNGVPSNNVIFNFSSAKTLDLNGIGFNGTILAPFADFTGTWGNVNGQVIAKSISGSVEFHDFLFNGKLPESSAVSAVPEPSSWMLLSGGLFLAFAARKRKLLAALR